MSETVQPSADWNSTRLAVAWALVNAHPSSLKLDPLEQAKLVHQVALQLKGVEKAK